MPSIDIQELNWRGGVWGVLGHISEFLSSSVFFL